MITLAPALAWGFADRGLLREGMVADLNVFDPDRRSGPAVPEVVDDLPAGGKRLVAAGRRASRPRSSAARSPSSTASRPARGPGDWCAGAARRDAQRIQSIRATRWWIIHVPSRRTISST